MDMRIVAVVCTGFIVSIAEPLSVFAQGGGYGGGYRRGGYASTAGQAAAYGMSEVIRAQGYANMQNSAAAKNWEQAKTMEIQNRELWTNTYFKMREENSNARRKEQSRNVLTDAEKEANHDRMIRVAKMSSTPRLRSTQLDPVTGHIEYPLILTDDRYASYREKLDALFSERATSGGSLQYSQYLAIQNAVQQFIDALKSQVGKVPAGDYGSARTFLNSLARETKYSSG
ncbi:MAG: hypothetical protein DWH80_03895 [Planctomycetota bacterium]|nr:MAG: hypothetical protein DWH80_03895 [Planctomycetota bacterium]